MERRVPSPNADGPSGDSFQEESRDNGNKLANPNLTLEPDFLPQDSQSHRHSQQRTESEFRAFPPRDIEIFQSLQALDQMLQPLGPDDAPSNTSSNPLNHSLLSPVPREDEQHQTPDQSTAGISEEQPDQSYSEEVPIALDLSTSYLGPPNLAIRHVGELSSTRPAVPSTRPGVHIMQSNPTGIPPSYPQFVAGLPPPTSIAYPMANHTHSMASAPRQLSVSLHPASDDCSRRVPLPYPLPPPRPTSSTEFSEADNPYRISTAVRPIPEGFIPCSPERMLQAWLIRQQLLVGIRPEQLQSMITRRGPQHRTPPWMMLNEAGAHVMRVEPARFCGTMLPMPSLPWLPRRMASDSSLPPIQDTSTTSDSSNVRDQSELPNDVNLPASLGSSPPAIQSTPTTLVLSNQTTQNAFSASNQPVAASSSAPRSPNEVRSVPSSGPEPLMVAPADNVAENGMVDHTPDPRVVAFMQPLRLLNPDHPNQLRADLPSAPEANTENPNQDDTESAVESHISGPRMADIVQALRPSNLDDSDSVVSQAEGSTSSSSASDEGADTRTGPASEAAHANGDVPLAVTWLESGGTNEPPTPRRRFLIDG